MYAINSSKTFVQGMYQTTRRNVPKLSNLTINCAKNSKYFRILCCNVLQVFVTSPYDFPVAGTDVTSGSTADVSLSAQVTYTTPQVFGLNVNRRGCLYENESRSLGFPSYSHGNCIAQCHRYSTLLYCNCTPYFYPTEGVNLSSRGTIVVRNCKFR